MINEAKRFQTLIGIINEEETREIIPAQGIMEKEELKQSRFQLHPDEEIIPLNKTIKGQIKSLVRNSSKVNAKTADGYSFTPYKNKDGKMSFVGGWDWISAIKSKQNMSDAGPSFMYFFNQEDERFYVIDGFKPVLNEEDTITAQGITEEQENDSLKNSELVTIPLKRSGVDVDSVQSSDIAEAIALMDFLYGPLNNKNINRLGELLTNSGIEFSELPIPEDAEDMSQNVNKIFEAFVEYYVSSGDLYSFVGDDFDKEDGEQALTMNNMEQGKPITEEDNQESGIKNSPLVIEPLKVGGFDVDSFSDEEIAEALGMFASSYEALKWADGYEDIGNIESLLSKHGFSSFFENSKHYEDFEEMPINIQTLWEAFVDFYVASIDKTGELEDLFFSDETTKNDRSVGMKKTVDEPEQNKPSSQNESVRKMIRGMLDELI